MNPEGLAAVIAKLVTARRVIAPELGAKEALNGQWKSDCHDLIDQLADDSALWDEARHAGRAASLNCPRVGYQGNRSRGMNRWIKMN